jgi:hypothetical protein
LFASNFALDRDAIRAMSPQRYHDLREIISRVVGCPIEQVDEARRGEDDK